MLRNQIMKYIRVNASSYQINLEDINECNSDTDCSEREICKDGECEGNHKIISVSIL